MSNQTALELLESIVIGSRERHKNQLNRIIHVIAFPMVAVSPIMLFIHWPSALVLFFFGRFIQIVGHQIEGNLPEQYKSPLLVVYIFYAPINFVFKETKRLLRWLLNGRK